MEGNLQRVNSLVVEKSTYQILGSHEAESQKFVVVVVVVVVGLVLVVGVVVVVVLGVVVVVVVVVVVSKPILVISPLLKSKLINSNSPCAFHLGPSEIVM